MEKISIIVPVYNSEKTLFRCLSSLQNQTYTNIEVIMIDDGSWDNSASVCTAFAQRDRRFRYSFQEHRGVSAARNRGLDLAQGAYIGFCDSDDWAEADMYETLILQMENEEADVSIVGYCISDDTEKLSSQGFSMQMLEGKEAVLQLHLRRLNIASSLWNKLFRKALFDHVRLDEEITNLEDMLAVWELLIQSKKVIYTSKPKYHYCVHSHSLSSEMKASYWSYRKAAYRMKEKMEQTMPENIAYAQRTIVLYACWSIERLLIRKDRADQYYAIARGDIVSQYSKEARKLFSVKERIMILGLSSGKYMASIFVKAMALHRMMKGLGKRKKGRANEYTGEFEKERL